MRALAQQVRAREQEFYNRRKSMKDYLENRFKARAVHAGERVPPQITHLSLRQLASFRLPL